MSETTNQQALIALLRKPILDIYGVDINHANVNISSRNMGFVFPNEDYVLRVNLVANNHINILSETVFVDYIKLFVDTICEPQPSLHGKLIERIDIEGKCYYVVKFKKARGRVSAIIPSDRMTYICAGDLLGRVHKASQLLSSEGFVLKRPQWDDQYIYSEQALTDLFPDGAPFLDNIRRFINDAKTLPKNVHTFGVIHGDFDPRNMFADANNLWLFDFDDCCYHYFAYDIATYLFKAIVSGIYRTGNTALDTYNEVLTPFLIGYTIHIDFTEEDRALIPILLMLRVVFGIMVTASVSQEVKSKELDFASALMTELLSYPCDMDVFERFDSIKAVHQQKHPQA